jgi:ribosomal protein S18 acetylase RimI-like enzyme
MPIQIIHNQQQLAAFLQPHREQAIYELGDLDPRYWPSTSWYALTNTHGAIEELLLAYNAGDLLVLLTKPYTSEASCRALIEGVAHLLPRRIYVHVPSTLLDAFDPRYQRESHGLHDRMTISAGMPVADLDRRGIVRLTPEDLGEIESFYAISYPDNWFDPATLATGHYYGFREDGQLRCVSGIHAFAPEQGVAALGNIATHPAARGRGLATRVVAYACHELLREVDTVGLNVKSANSTAINCYQRVGFRFIHQFEEIMLTFP